MNGNAKLVSVVVQAYNSSGTITQTLDSVKAQTYPNIELIITDDKSRDNTIEVASKWMEANRGVLADMKLVTAKVNTGIPGSNNRALRHVSGEYVEFLAADDCMMPDAIQQYVDFCENNPDVIPISKVELLPDGECDTAPVQRYCDRCYAYAMLDRKQQYQKLLMQNWIVAPAAAFYPVRILHRLNGFDEAYRWMEDYPLNLKLLRKGCSFGLIDRELIQYRISGSSITGSGLTPLKRTEARLFFREKLWYMIGAGMGREAVGQTGYWLKILIAKSGRNRE